MTAAIEKADIKTLVSPLRRTSANVDQIAKRVSSTNRIYKRPCKTLHRLGDVRLALEDVLTKLAAIE